MPLSETAIKNAKPGEKPRKMSDGRGLYLLVHPNGGKWFRYKYRFGGKEKSLSLGTYPDVELKKARKRLDEARQLLADGIDPGVNRKAIKAAGEDRAANSFEIVAREWFSKQQATWAEGHSSKIIARLENDIFPWIGASPIAAITAADLLGVLRRIEGRGVGETARRALNNCAQVFRYAVATGRAARDPCGDLRGALAPVKGKHLAAVTDPSQVGALLATLYGYEGSPIVSAALRLAPLVFVRPGELRTAQWADIDLDTAEWRYAVTKTNTQHIVPLATQAVEILRELQPLTGRWQYVFPNGRSRNRPMSNVAILAAMRRVGIPKEEMSGHGFRAMARTILDEVLHVRPDFIEHCRAFSPRSQWACIQSDCTLT